MSLLSLHIGSTWALHVTGFMRVSGALFQSTRDYWLRVWVRMSYTGEFYIVHSDYITGAPRSS
jgi:hypothetical protein